MKRFALFFVLVLSFAVVSVPSARGQEAAETTPHQSAVSLGHRGLSHYSAGRFLQARDDFEEAERRVHSPVFLLYQARAERELGHLLRARGLFQQCTQESILEASPDAWKAAVVEAREELVRLSRDIPSVRFLVDGGATYPLEIRIGQEVVLVTSEHEFVHEFDPGAVDLGVLDAGGTRIGSRVVLSVGEKEKVVLLAFPRIFPVQVQEPTVSVPSEFYDEKKPGRAMRRGAYAAFSLGGSAFLFSAVATTIAVSKARAVKRNCIEESCRPEDQDLAQSAVRWANLATAGVVAGTTGVAAGLGLLLSSPREGVELSYRGSF